MAKEMDLSGLGKSKKPQSEQPKQISLDNTKPMKCHKCNGEIFVEGTVFRKVSRLLTGSPQDMIQPIPVYLCGNCGTVLEEMLPAELRYLNEETEE